MDNQEYKANIQMYNELLRDYKNKKKTNFKVTDIVEIASLSVLVSGIILIGIPKTYDWFCGIKRIADLFVFTGLALVSIIICEICRCIKRTTLQRVQDSWDEVETLKKLCYAYGLNPKDSDAIDKAIAYYEKYLIKIDSKFVVYTGFSGLIGSIIGATVSNISKLKEIIDAYGISIQFIFRALAVLLIIFVVLYIIWISFKNTILNNVLHKSTAEQIILRLTEMRDFKDFRVNDYIDQMDKIDKNKKNKK